MPGRPEPIYLDAHSTTPVDPRVLDAMLPTFSVHFGNPSSMTHSFGWYAAELVQIAREQVADLVGADPDEVVFTSGATEACALGILGRVAAERRLRPESRMHVVVSSIEHRAVLDPVLALRESGVEVSVLPVGSDGRVSPEVLATHLRPETILTCVMLANNEIGTVQPISEIGAVVRRHGSALLVDAAQGPGRIPLESLRVADFATLSAHKFYGPKGVGALISRKGRFAIDPIFSGGGQERGIRSGTLNVSGIVGFGAAAQLAKAERGEDSQRMTLLAGQLVQILRTACPEMVINGSAEHRLPGNVHVAFPGVDNVRLLGVLGTTVAMSASSACQSGSKEPSHVLQALGIDERIQRSCIRIGLSRMTTRDDIARAGELLSRALAGMHRL